ncbi:MAG: hypothetical protein WAK93_10105 [Solirubrobacteraceae bacterium]
MKVRGRDAVPALICPACGARSTAAATDQRFCPQCRVPLVLEGGDEMQPVSERHRRARMIKPQLAEGRLVRVAGASNQAEGEFIQGLLLEEGVPSLLRRSAGFDVPDMLAAGPRDVMVPISGADTARQVLLQADLLSAPVPQRPVDPTRLLVGILVALALGALVVWAMSLVVH